MANVIKKHGAFTYGCPHKAWEPVK